MSLVRLGLRGITDRIGLLQSNGRTVIFGTFLLFASVPFVLATLYFGTKGGYYNTAQYKGNGTAH